MNDPNLILAYGGILFGMTGLGILYYNNVERIYESIKGWINEKVM